MTDAFADLVLPIFEHVIVLQDRLAWGENATLDEIKDQIRAWIDSAEQRAVVDSDLAAEFALAKYALVYWIDEVLTDSDWGRSVDWGSEDHVLEWDYYRERLRAEEFERKAAVAERRRAIDALETFLLSVALGYRGNLAIQEKHLREWIERVYTLISEASPLSSRPFPDDDAGASRSGLTPLRGPAIFLTVSILTAITAVTTLLGYLGSVYLAYEYPR